MFIDVQDFLRYYRGLHKRTMRDIAALPPEAADYRPPAALAERAGDGENTWSIGEIVRHIGGARLYFARAYRGEGWIFDGPAREVNSQDDWIPVLEETFDEFNSRLADTPAEYIQRKVEMIDTDGSLSGLAHPDDVRRARGPPPLPDRHLRRPQRLGPAADLRPLGRAGGRRARNQRAKHAERNA